MWHDFASLSVEWKFCLTFHEDLHLFKPWHFDFWSCLQFKGDLNAQDAETNMTPLHWAVYNGHSEMVKFFTSAGADPDIGGMGGNTALHYAILRLQLANEDKNGKNEVNVVKLVRSKRKKEKSQCLLRNPLRKQKVQTLHRFRFALSVEVTSLIQQHVTH